MCELVDETFLPQESALLTGYFFILHRVYCLMRSFLVGFSFLSFQSDFLFGHSANKETEPKEDNAKNCSQNLRPESFIIYFETLPELFFAPFEFVEKMPPSFPKKSDFARWHGEHPVWLSKKLEIGIWFLFLLRKIEWLLINLTNEFHILSLTQVALNVNTLFL